MSTGKPASPIERLFSTPCAMTAAERRGVGGAVAAYIDTLFATGSFSEAQAAARAAPTGGVSGRPRSYKAPVLAAPGAPRTLAEGAAFGHIVDYLVEAIRTDGDRALVPWLLELQKSARPLERELAVRGSDRVDLSADELRDGYLSILVSLAGVAGNLTERAEDVPRWEQIGSELGDLPVALGNPIERRIFLEATLALSDDAQRLLGRDAWLRPARLCRTQWDAVARSSQSARDWPDLLGTLWRSPKHPLSVALLLYWPECDDELHCSAVSSVAGQCLKADPAGGPLVRAALHLLERRLPPREPSWSDRVLPWPTSLWLVIDHEAARGLRAVRPCSLPPPAAAGKASLDRSEQIALLRSLDAIRSVKGTKACPLWVLFQGQAAIECKRVSLQAPVATYIDVLTECWDLRHAAAVAGDAVDEPLPAQPFGWTHLALPLTLAPHIPRRRDEQVRVVLKFVAQEVAERGERALLPWVLQLLRSPSAAIRDAVFETLEGLALDTELLRVGFRSVLRAVAHHAEDLALGLLHEHGPSWRRIRELVNDVALRLGRGLARRVFLEETLALSERDQVRLSEHVWLVADAPRAVGSGSLQESASVRPFEELLTELARSPARPFSLGLLLRWPEAREPTLRARVQDLARQCLHSRPSGPLVNAVLQLWDADALALSPDAYESVLTALTARLRYLEALGPAVDLQQLMAIEHTHEAWRALRASADAPASSAPPPHDDVVESPEFEPHDGLPNTFFEVVSEDRVIDVSIDATGNVSLVAGAERVRVSCLSVTERDEPELALPDSVDGPRVEARVLGYTVLGKGEDCVSGIVYSYVVDGREYAFAYPDWQHKERVGKGVTTTVAYAPHAPREHAHVAGPLTGHTRRIGAWDYTRFLGSLALRRVSDEQIYRWVDCSDFAALRRYGEEMLNYAPSNLLPLLGLALAECPTTEHGRVARHCIGRMRAGLAVDSELLHDAWNAVATTLEYRPVLWPVGAAKVRGWAGLDDRLRCLATSVRPGRPSETVCSGPAPTWDEGATLQ